MIPNEGLAPISLYFHIPFCKRKCDYCHFYVIPDKDAHKSLLMEGLKREWAYRLPQIQGHPIETVYFGGGTPSLLGPAAIAEILSWIHEECAYVFGNPEITLEANPDGITPSLIQAFRVAGINRISLGVQTFDDALLRQIGRLHSATDAIEAVDAIRSGGIENISIDLMYDLPNQNLSSWKDTLAHAARLPISHLSLYNLSIEPHTVFYKHRKTIEAQIPTAATSLEMYQEAIRVFTSGGFQQYEISAFCKEGCASQHNTGYWKARPFMGYGPSAFSYWEGSRFRNIAHLNRYHRLLSEGASPVDFEETLPEEQSQRELLTIRLRLLEGISLPEFEAKHGRLSPEVHETLQRLEREGYVIQDRSGHLMLTHQGLLHHDTVAVELI